MNSYCPYSKFSVSCSIKMNNGKVYTGVNVENCSFGLSSCAEANAIAKAISDNAYMYDIKEIIIETNTAPKITPCGACLQILYEHIPYFVPIICIGTASNKKYHINQLLPYPFVYSRL